MFKSYQNSIIMAIFPGKALYEMLSGFEYKNIFKIIKMYSKLTKIGG